jgi:hypothetical protein
MVRALLDGTKTQTRRVAKPQPYVDEMGNACWNGLNFGQDGRGTPLFKSMASPLPSSRTGRPHGAPGDRLWVRECHYLHGIWSVRKDDDGKRRWTFHPNQDMGVQFTEPSGFIKGRSTTVAGWYRRPSIHMPRWASRITLEVTRVRVERLQDISEADAIAEGTTPIPDPCDHVRLSCSDIGCSGPKPYTVGFRSLWESINGTGSWSANHLVWVVEFKRVEAA